MKIINIKVYNGSEWIDYSLDAHQSVEKWIPIDKQSETSFSTKVRDGDVDNQVTAAMSVAIGDKNIVGVKRSLTLGHGNSVTEDEETDIGGSNNLVVGANNKVVASTGATIGNGNIVGDIDGTGITGTANHIKNSLISGIENNVQSSNYVLVSGERNTVVNSSDSVILGKNNTSDSFGSVALIGESLTATQNYQTVVGAGNDPTEQGYFIVGIGGEDNPHNAFVVGSNKILNKVGATFESSATFNGSVEFDKFAHFKDIAQFNEIRTSTIQASIANLSFLTIGSMSSASAIFNNIKVNGPIIATGYINVDKSSTFKEDITVNRGLYCPNIFKGVPTDATDRDNKTVLSKKEINDRLANLDKLIQGLTIEQIDALNAFAKKLTIVNNI